MTSLSGIWTGTYFFQDEAENEIGVEFIIILTEKNGELEGECNDIGEKGIPEPAQIDGFVENNIVSFIKQHTPVWYKNEEGNLENDTSRPHPEIHSQGELMNGEISGT
jgi:hypothetical protein